MMSFHGAPAYEPMSTTPNEPPPATGEAPLPAANPFAAPSALPLRYPAFDRIDDDAFRPAFDAGMAVQRAEMRAIAECRDAPTFDNTIVAIERSGQLLERTRTAFFNLSAADADPARRRIQVEMSPRLSAHFDAIHFDPLLFRRVETIHAQRATLGLDTESDQLLTRTYTRFARAGAALSDADKATLRILNETLSSLTTTFQHHVLQGAQAAAVEVDDIRRLDGLSAPQIAAAESAAKARGLDGRWLLPLQNTTTQPILAQMKDRALRRHLHDVSAGRNIGGPFDTTAVVADIVRLRAERAKLLGFPSHAAWVLADETAGSTHAVNALLARITAPAIANAKAEAAAIQQVIDRQAAAAGTPSFALEAWDWAFYAEQVRQERHAFDDARVRPYFELENVLRDGVFFSAERLFGLRFPERHDLPVYGPDVRVFDVIDHDGMLLAIFITDFYARDTKKGGAWMSEYVAQSRLFDERPVIANHLNVPKPPAGEPTLLTFEEVTTMFHEFGHALHGMFSDVRFRSLAGTRVPRDFVEYPSQYNEMWARDPEVMANYAKHYRTGEPLPADLLEKVLGATGFGQGFRTTEYLAAATLDQCWHQMAAGETPAVADVTAFEARALDAAGLRFGPVLPRYRSTYFSHIFSGGYSAGYYAYLWSELLARDTEQWMKSHGGLRRENGDRLRSTVLSKGRSIDVLDSFRSLHGREPEIEPLLAHRGLVRTPGSD